MQSAKPVSTLPVLTFKIIVSPLDSGCIANAWMWGMVPFTVLSEA